MLFIPANLSLKSFQLISKTVTRNFSSVRKKLFVVEYSRPCKMELKTQVKGQTINYLKVGNGDKKVLCFPGALGTIWSDFKPQIEGLDKSQFTIIAWDPPGYGFSRPPERKFDIAFYESDADCAHFLMKELEIEKYSLLGWSDGGISSLILSSKYPKNIEKLVVWGSNAFVTEKDMSLYEKVRDINKWSEQMKAPLVKMYSEQGLSRMWNGWCDAMVEILKNRGGDICKKGITEIQCPTLVVHGDKDPLVGLDHAEYLVDNIKNAKLHRYPDGKHNLHLRYAEDFNKLVSDFLLK